MTKLSAPQSSKASPTISGEQAAQHQPQDVEFSKRRMESEFIDWVDEW
jgi:hypothetical protein